MKCPYCGKEVPDGVKFCGYCGAKLDEAKAPIDVTPAEPETSSAETPVRKRRVRKADTSPGESSAPKEASQEEVKDTQKKPAEVKTEPEATAEAVHEEAPASAEAEPKQTASGHVRRGTSPNVHISKESLPKVPKKVLGIIAAVAVLVVVLICVSVSHANAVNLGDYVTITYSGANGYGTAEVDFDSVRFGEENQNKLKLRNDTLEKRAIALNVPRDEMYAEMADDMIDLKLDKTSGLSNGDTVTATIDATEFNTDVKGNIKTPKSISVKVSGLKEPTKVDAFSMLPVKFSGISGHGTVSLDFDQINAKYDLSLDDYDMDGYIMVEPSTGLRNGDKVTITLTDDCVSLISQYAGVVPESTSETLEVSGLPEMEESAASFTEDQLAPFKAQGEDVIRQAYAGFNDFVSVTSVEYVGNYFLLNKKTDVLDSLRVDDTGRITGSDDYNRLAMLYKVTLHYSSEYGESDMDVYEGILFRNLYTDANGNPEVADITSGRLLGSNVELDTGLTGKGFADISQEITLYTNDHGYASLDDAKEDIIDQSAVTYTSEENMK